MIYEYMRKKDDSSSFRGYSTVSDSPTTPGTALCEAELAWFCSLVTARAAVALALGDLFEPLCLELFSIPACSVPNHSRHIGHIGHIGYIGYIGYIGHDHVCQWATTLLADLRMWGLYRLPLALLWRDAQIHSSAVRLWWATASFPRSSEPMASQQGTGSGRCHCCNNLKWPCTFCLGPEDESQGVTDAPSRQAIVSAVMGDVPGATSTRFWMVKSVKFGQIYDFWFPDMGVSWNAGSPTMWHHGPQY